MLQILGLLSSVEICLCFSMSLTLYLPRPSMVRLPVALNHRPVTDLLSTSKAHRPPIFLGQPFVRSSRTFPGYGHKISSSTSRRIPPRREAHLYNTAEISLASNDIKFKSISSRLASVSIENIYEQLLSEASQGHVDNVYNIVTHLVKERHEEPNLRQYDALILVNIDPINGSATKAAALWKELKDEGLNAESGTYHKILKVS